MTSEEAIKIIEVAKAECEWNAPLEYQGAFDMAIESLKKQIPMEPLEKEYSNDLGENIHVYVIPCGKCGHAINFLHSYCPWCGQKIDWKEDE